MGAHNKCRKTVLFYKEFITEVTKEVIASKQEVEIEEIFGIIEDTLRYLEDNEFKEYNTN